MEKLVRTWLEKENKWFDQKDIFEFLKEDIINMLDSKFLPKKGLRKIFFPFLLDKTYIYKD